MKKKDLARIVTNISWQARKERFDVEFFDTEHLTINSSEQWLAELFSNCAGVKVVKGKITHKGCYLVSRGREFYSCKPTAIIEYSNHWPYDFCYVYKL